MAATFEKKYQAAASPWWQLRTVVRDESNSQVLLESCDLAPGRGFSPCHGSSSYASIAA